MAPGKQLRILSLDGGGIRGLSSLVILRRIMHMVRENMDPPPPTLEPCQYFDLIGGTSTGGIIAIMLGRLRMSIDECIGAYSKLGEEVFSERHSVGPMFKAAKLEAAIKKAINQKLGEGHANDPLMDPLGRDCCKTVVYTLPLLHPDGVQPTALRTYTSKFQPPIECTIWQAARATSAAPVFFDPVAIGEPAHAIHWIDAGMKFNNPSQAILTEAGRLWGNEMARLDEERDIACFLSLGTGFPKITRLDANTIWERVSKKLQVPLKAVEVLKSIATDTETVHNNMERRLEDTIYHRFNVEQGLQEVQLFEYEKEESIVVDTDHYLESEPRTLARCVRCMKELVPQLSPVAEHEDCATVFPSGAENDEAALRRRLQALRINHQDFEHHQKIFEKSDTYVEQLGKIAGIHTQYMYNPFLQADYLDKQGRAILEGLEHVTGRYRVQLSIPSSNSQSTKEPEVALWYDVKRRMLGYEKLSSAFLIYRQLLYTTEWYWSRRSLEYCWVANRLGRVLEIFGMRTEALDLYIRAAEGRHTLLGAEHRKTKESQERAERLLR